MTISAVILAGGEGRRMQGLDKGLVIFDGKKMIQWTVDRVKPLVEKTMISCNRNIGDYMVLADSVVCDRIAGSLGPLAGVHAAMESASAPLLLVLPCDTPLLKASLIQRLIECALEHCDSIVCLEDGEYSHPLHAVIPLSLKQSLEDYLIGGGRSVVKWYAMHQVIRLKVSSEESVTLANINRPSDIEMHKA